VTAIRWVVRAMHRLACFARGHELIFHFEPDRLSLRCIACGYETKGWNFGERTPNAFVVRIARRQRLQGHRAA